MRDAQVANANPLRKKVASTALRAVISSRLAVPVERLTRDTLSGGEGRRDDDHGAAP
jgi:hypothetical protein